MQALAGDGAEVLDEAAVHGPDFEQDGRVALVQQDVDDGETLKDHDGLLLEMVRGNHALPERRAALVLPCLQDDHAHVLFLGQRLKKKKKKNSRRRRKKEKKRRRRKKSHRVNWLKP